MEQKGKMEMEVGMQDRVSVTEYKYSSIMVIPSSDQYNSLLLGEILNRFFP